jgi:TM2 domain-containing membrane protein YozV
MTSDRWEEAAQYFGMVSEEHELKLLCEEVEKDKYSVTFARVISYILPGAGQFYTGSYFSGFMSLAWNVLWGYLTVDAFIADRAFDGAAIGSLLWLRFYRGNIQNAGKFAEEKNIEIANNAYLYLMKNYKGEKP